MKMDRKSLRIKVILEVASSMPVLIPTLTGISFLLGVWTFSIQGGIVVFAGVLALLIGAGIFLSTILNGSHKIIAKIQKRIAEAALQKAEEELDILEEMLAKDGDERTHTAFKDLRSLKKIAEKTEGSVIGLSITHQVNDLFNACVKSLQHQYEMYETGKSLTNAKAKTSLNKERQAIIKNVVDSVSHLSEVVTKTQTMNNETAAPLLEDKRREIDEQIEIAQKVSERMLSWQQKIS